MAFSKDFLWGGAVAGNQYEGGFQDGGRGLSTMDAVTGGGYQKPRMVTYQTEDGRIGESPIDSSMTGSIPKGAAGYITIDSIRPFRKHPFRLYEGGSSRWKRSCMSGRR